jgi:glutamine amidotransferase
MAEGNNYRKQKIADCQIQCGKYQVRALRIERIGIEAKVTDLPQEIKDADKVIFPGVGEASSAMKYLKARGLDELIRNLNQPVLHLSGHAVDVCPFEENNTHCLGIFDTSVRNLNPGR